MRDIFKIKPTGDHTAEIVVNGLDVSEAVTGYYVRHMANDMPRVDLYLHTIPEFEGPANVKVPDHTRAALIALGWTAPPEQKED